MNYKILLAIQIAGFTATAQNTATERARQAAVDRTLKSIESECLQYGKGNWEEYFKTLAPFRSSLLQNIAAANARYAEHLPDAARKPGFLIPFESAGTPPLFYDTPSALYLADAKDGLEAWVHSRGTVSTIVGTAKFLKQKFGIDLLFVPVPTVVEVYPERFADHVPPHRIVAPHVRGMLAELLRNNVEVLDLLPMLLKARDTTPEPLYYYTDPHWSGPAMKLASREIATRLKRYPFLRKTAAVPAQFKAEDIRVPYKGFYYTLLWPERQRELEDCQTSTFTQVKDLKGALLADARTSPVVVVGDSYVAYSTFYAPGTALDALLSKDINLRAGRISVEGGAFNAIIDLIRDPELRSTCKVLVLVITMRAVAQDPWGLPAAFQR